jgi:hypothetical protein
MTPTITIEILTKKECSLCDAVKETVGRVIRDYPARMMLTDIESDPQLFAQYKEKIPVVKINGEEQFVYKVKEQVLRKKLDLLVNSA